MPEPVDLDLVLRRVAAGPFPTNLPDVPPLDRYEVYQLINQADATSLLGGLFGAWTRGEVPLTDDQQAMLAVAHQTAMRHALQVEQRLIDAADRLESAGVDFRLLKGVVLANALYPDPATRSFADADLLIGTGQMSLAAGALIDAGGRRNIPELFPGHDDRFAKSVTVIVAGRALDLHRTLLSGPFGVTVPVDELLERSFPVPIGGRQLRALDVSDLYIHAAVTAGAVDVPPRLVTFADMCRLERASGFSPDEVLRRSAHYGLAAAVARGVRLQQDALLLADPPRLLRWASGYRAPWRERALLRTYLGRGRSYRRTLATLVSLRTWRQRAAFTRAIAMPAAEYRAARTWTRRDHLTRASRKLLGR